jgi:HK97 family phage major capsid protein
MVLPGLGMQIMSGLSTKIQIPKVSAGASAAFVAESGAVSDNTQTTAQLTLVARTLGARTSVSRLLLLESDPSIEAIVRNDLVAAVANKIEDVLIEGGGSNEPTGITQVGGNLGTVALGTNGAAPTWASITNLVKEVETDNAAINAGTLGFLTNPKVKSKLANTAKVGSSDSVMILNDPWNALYGYPMAITTNCPSDLTKGTGSALSAMIFGDFSQLIMASFGGGPDILVDPYSSSNDGTVKILIFSEIDSAVKHDESFAVITDMVTT